MSSAPIEPFTSCLHLDPRFDQLGQPFGGMLREVITSVRRHLEVLDCQEAWRVAMQELGLTNGQVTRMILTDLPRYECPEATASCEHPMTAGENLGRECGRPGIDHARLYTADGTWRRTWRCRDHHGELWDLQQRSRQQERSIPDPKPNRGGLLAAYLPAFDWVSTYALVCPSWTLPSHGVNADDWSPDINMRPTLRLLPAPT